MGELLRFISEILTLIGALFFLISALGLLRLPDFYCRIHAPTKAATLGIILLGLGAVLRSLASGGLLWIEELAILVFLFLTIPVSAQILARTALRRRVRQTGRTTGERSTPPDDH